QRTSVAGKGDPSRRVRWERGREAKGAAVGSIGTQIKEWEKLEKDAAERQEKADAARRKLEAEVRARIKAQQRRKKRAVADGDAKAVAAADKEVAIGKATLDHIAAEDDLLRAREALKSAQKRVADATAAKAAADAAATAAANASKNQPGSQALKDAAE